MNTSILSDRAEPANSAVSRAWNVFPGGSLGEYGLPRERSIVLARGSGARVWDENDREYLDFTMGWGSVLLGHADPTLTSALSRQLDRGTNFAYISEPTVELGEQIVKAVPCAERVRFCASGTEATMYAVRFARAFTGHNSIVKFEGAYHGANEFGAVSLFPSDPHPLPEPTPTSAGIPQGTLDSIRVAPYNDLETTRTILKAHRSDLAAVIVEPFHRCLKPAPGFLEGLRQVTRELGILLIFDEVVTGFRLAYGGAQEYYGVEPDLAALGKGLGGGMPIGAIAGRAEILDLCDEARIGQDGYVWFASSVGGNPMTATAALVTLERLRQPGCYEHLFSA